MAKRPSKPAPTLDSRSERMVMRMHPDLLEALTEEARTHGILQVLAR